MLLLPFTCNFASSAGRHCICSFPNLISVGIANVKLFIRSPHFSPKPLPYTGHNAGTPSAEASIQPAHVRTILAFARRLFPSFSSSTLPFPYVSDNGSMIQKSKEALFSPLCFLGRTISHFHFTVNNNS